MNENQATDADVIVAGAGPTGMMAAAELALAGVRPLVLDKAAERTTQFRAGGVQTRTAELLDQRGLLAPLLATGDFPVTTAGQFGGLPVDFQAWPSRQPSYFIPQKRIEEFLERHLAERGIPLVRGREVIDVTPKADGVIVTASGPDGVARYRGQYLVAADGSHSSVRRILGVDFPGRAGTSTSVIADVALTGVTPERHGHAWGQGGHWAMLYPLDYQRQVYRLVLGAPGPSPAKDTEVGVGELRCGLHAVHGDGIEVIELLRAIRIDDAARQIASYRAGRVFFAGDAAHIHLPLGGQGMNLGLGDAVNLSWKLAAAVHGWAPEGLLNTYHSERHPVAARVLANTRTQSVLLDWAAT
jgi:2-polyprenyl-6-methoxyphenol hydroxylase-like FAD-dependent oxidoreductase